MPELQNSTERQYRTVVEHLAIMLLVFWGLFHLCGTALTEWVPLLASLLPTPFDVVLYESFDGVFYAISFLVPVGVFYRLRRGAPRVSVDLALRLPPETPLYIFAVLALVSGAVLVNSWLTSFLDFSIFTVEEVVEVSASTNVELILSLFTHCIVPAFVEELLFRGIILKHLAPFGKASAVLASALLFGLMHQSVNQFFYATVAGLALGYVLLQTRSLWCCILIHFCNNFLSLFSSAVGERLPGQQGMTLLFVLEVVIFAFGIVAIVALVLRAKGTPDGERDDEEILPLSRRLPLFFSLPMVIYVALCGAQMAVLVLFELIF